MRLSVDVTLGFQPERWRPPRPFWRRAAGGVFFRFFLVIAVCHKKKQKSAQYPPPPRVVADFQQQLNDQGRAIEHGEDQGRLANEHAWSVFHQIYSLMASINLSR